MSNVAKGNNEKKEKTLDELKTEFKKVADEIRSVLKGRNDINELTDSEKTALRPLYIQASNLANTISKRALDDKTKEDYQKLYNAFGAKLTQLGSAMKMEIPKTTLDDVKGLDGVKELVRSFLFMAENAEALKVYNLQGGLGMLMYGAPGTGKTMFAEAIANHMQWPLFVVTPADIFKSYVGQSEQAVKQIFEEMDQCPDGAILFVDECESIFSIRTQDTKDYKSAVTTELLQRINGFGVNGAKRIMVAATNRPEMIDPAYLRFKRFSHLIHIEPPDPVALKSIINSKIPKDPRDKSKYFLDGITAEDVFAMAEDHMYETLEMDDGSSQRVLNAHYSAADICGIVEEACRLAIEKMQTAKSTVPIPLTREMFQTAFNKIKPSISEELLTEYRNFR